MGLNETDTILVVLCVASWLTFIPLVIEANRQNFNGRRLFALFGSFVLSLGTLSALLWLEILERFG